MADRVGLAGRKDRCGGRRLEELRDEVLHGPRGDRQQRLQHRGLFARSPVTQQLLDSLTAAGEESVWKLLALGRMPLAW